MTTTWSSEGQPFTFIAARHCLSSLSGRWIRVNKRQITCALALYGFVVNANSFDGATENRSAMNQDLTLTLKQVLPEFLDAEGINKEASNVCEDGCDDDVSSSLPCDDDIQQYLKETRPDTRTVTSSSATKNTSSHGKWRWHTLTQFVKVFSLQQLQTCPMASRRRLHFDSSQAWD